MRYAGLLLFAAIFAFGPAWAAEVKVGEDLQASLREVIWKMEKETPDRNELLERMKASGASYTAELAADPARADSYVNEETQRLMVGVYLMDMSYAFVFGKNKDSVGYATAIDGLLAKLGFSNKRILQQYQAALRDVDSPGGKESLLQLEKAIESSWTDYITTANGVAMAVEGIYGWMVEGLYLVMELAAQNNYDPAFVKYIDEQRASIRAMIGIYEALTDHPLLAQIVQRDERMEMLNDIFAQMKNLDTDTIGSEQLDSVRILVAEARAKLVK